MNKQTLDRILAEIPRLQIALLGDACVDAYWDADMTQSELSRETPQFPYPVVAERYSLGAGANVGANLAALGANVRFVGFTGRDWRGQTLRGLFAEQGISDSYLVLSDENVTPAYCKPILHGISDVTYEAPRLDFVNRKPISAGLEDRLLRSLDAAVQGADTLIVCDQFRFGCVTPRIRERLEALGQNLPVLVDSRDRLNEFRGFIVKPNEVEAARALGIPAFSASDRDSVQKAAVALEQRNGRPVLLTLGGNGAVWCENGICVHVPAYRVQPPIDFVGAGDSFLAGFSCAHALRIPPADRLSFACLVSAVTIQKLGVTGTASPEELRRELARQTPDAGDARSEVAP